MIEASACVRDDIRPVTLEIVSKDDHVGDIERSYRDVKEGIRGTVQSLPYRKVPKIMITYLVQDTIKPKNALPATDGICDNVSPLSIVLGRGPIDYTQLKIEFGAYAQVFEDNDVTNTADTRSIGGIALASFPKENGKYPFMNLNTGRLLWRRRFTKLLIADLVIQRVHQLATNDKQKTIVGGNTLVEQRPGVTIPEDDDQLAIEAPPLDDDDDLVTLPPPIDPSDILLDNPPEPVPHPATPLLLTDNEDTDTDLDSLNDIPSEDDDVHDDDASTPLPPTDDDTSLNLNIPDDTQRSDTINEDQRSDGDDSVQRSDSASTATNHAPDTTIDAPDDIPEPSHGYNTRNRRTTYGFRLANKMNEGDNKTSFEVKNKEISHEMQFTQYHELTELPPSENIDDKRTLRDYTIEDLETAFENVDNDPKDALQFITHYMFTQLDSMIDPSMIEQMNAMKGIIKFGDIAIQALMKEITQLIDLSVFNGINPNKSTKQQKREVLRAISLIKLKKSMIMKG